MGLEFPFIHVLKMTQYIKNTFFASFFSGPYLKITALSFVAPSRALIKNSGPLQHEVAHPCVCAQGVCLYLCVCVHFAVRVCVLLLNSRRNVYICACVQNVPPLNTSEKKRLLQCICQWVCERTLCVYWYVCICVSVCVCDL